MNDIEYEFQVINLLNGGKNIIDRKVSSRKKGEFYQNLKKRHPLHFSLARLPHSVKKDTKTIEINDQESEDYWDLIRKKIIEKSTSIADIYEMMDKNNDGALNFEEFQSVII